MAERQYPAPAERGQQMAAMFPGHRTLVLDRTHLQVVRPDTEPG
jgi:hypothetical protein